MYVYICRYVFHLLMYVSIDTYIAQHSIAQRSLA